MTLRLALIRVVMAVALFAAGIYQYQTERLWLALAAFGLSPVLLLLALLRLRDLSANTTETPPPASTAVSGTERRRSVLAPAEAAAPTPQPAPAEAPKPAPTHSFEQFHARFALPGLALHRPYPPIGLIGSRSHIGGLPCLAPGMAWPRAESDSGCMPAGTPLHFLAQIDLAEQPWLPEHFPRSGTLLFFGMLPDEEGYYWSTANDSRVLYDPLSQGTPTQPPAELLPIDKTGYYSRTFGEEVWPDRCTWPYWPLQGHRIETMPDPGALLDGHLEWAHYDAYADPLNDFRAKQAATAFGLDLTALANHVPPTIDELLGEPGFPHVARCAGLFARALCHGPPDAPAQFFELAGQWIAWADSRPAGEPSGAEAAHEFALLLEHWPWSEAKHGRTQAELLHQVVERLVRESGGDPLLAANLPKSFYERALHQHTLVWPDQYGGSRKDGTRRWEVNHHQMGGHVPSTQEPTPIGHGRLCLLQLQTDYGSEMMLCDVGEADFWIKPADLAQAAFLDVEGDTRGG